MDFLLLIQSFFVDYFLEKQKKTAMEISNPNRRNRVGCDSKIFRYIVLIVYLFSACDLRQSPLFLEKNVQTTLTHKKIYYLGKKFHFQILRFKHLLILFSCMCAWKPFLWVCSHRPRS